MRLALLFILLASPVFAQSDADSSAACGPAGVKFDVAYDQAPPTPEVPPGKARIYIIEDVGGDTYGWITIRMALDGAWIGATRQQLFFIRRFARHPASLRELAVPGETAEL